MYGRFTQFQNRDAYFDALGVADGDYIHDPEPIGRYNVALSTNVLLLNMRNGLIQLDPVYWGMVRNGGISSRSSMPEVKPPPAAGCSHNSQ